MGSFAKCCNSIFRHVLQLYLSPWLQIKTIRRVFLLFQMSTILQTPKTKTILQATKTKPLKSSENQPYHNLYFFRNMISNHVVISKTFQIVNEKGARQLRMNRNQLVLRKDHFVNFMVLTGIKSIQIQGASV